LLQQDFHPVGLVDEHEVLQTNGNRIDKDAENDDPEEKKVCFLWIEPEFAILTTQPECSASFFILIRHEKPV
jgi:hypothetical protein